MFDEKELELVISGLGKVDVEDWKNNTRLKGCSINSNIVIWFWKVIKSFITHFNDVTLCPSNRLLSHMMMRSEQDYFSLSRGPQECLLKASSHYKVS